MSTIPTFAKILVVCALFTPLVMFSGCANETTELAEDQQSAPVKDTDATSIAASPAATEVSPAKIEPKAAPDADATFDQSPERLCQHFMKLLQANESIKAEALLTRMSQMNTTQEELELKAIGGPSAKFSVGQVSYATLKKELAQVDCKIVDTTSDDPFEMDLTWLVKRQKKSWRVAGVMLQIEENAKMDLLSFENLDDVRRIKSINDQQVLDVDTGIQATPEAKISSAKETTLQ